MLEVPVLIIGAGPVGLGLALDLACRGIDARVVDRTDGVVRHSKMGVVSVRSMEFCRQWGIVDRVRNCGFPEDYALNMVYCTSMSGHRISVREYPSMRDQALTPETPEKKQRCPQLWFDPILAQALRERGAERLRHHCEYVSHTEQTDHVLVKLRDLKTNEAFDVRAQYLVGCDGAGSSVCRAVGIELDGEPVLSYSVGIYIRSPGLLKKHDKGSAERYIFLGEDGAWGQLTVVDGSELWRVTVIGSKERVEAADFDAGAWVRRAMGADDIDFTIESVLPWRRSKLVAKSYSLGRVFIAGDAAHMMSPNGGYGMNTGIGDAGDLAWKLAARLNGWGGAGLLDSYDVERRPVGVRNVSAAAGNFSRLRAKLDYSGILEDTPRGEAKRREVAATLDEGIKRQWEVHGVSLGYRYENSPICVPDGTPPTPDDMSDYVPTARPGHRVPHAWLADGRSILDLYGKGFRLLDFGAAARASDPLVAAANAKGVPIEVSKIDDPAIAKLYERKLVLVRPDGNSAWRGDAAPADSASVMDTVRGAAVA